MTPTSAGEHFHPLEIIPYFRRFPRSSARDFAYTFLWNGLFGLGIYAVSALSAGTLPSLRVLGLQVLVANIVGYTIHALFSLGEVVKLRPAARRSGLAGKTAYFAGIPMLGVAIGFWITSFIIDPSFREWLTRPDLVVTMLVWSLAISVVLTVVFFWRERGAVAEAQIARERERSQGIEREAALAHLRALQAQIEPHFLFNTLANVTSLVDADPAQAKRMLESFIRFLRTSLAATRQELTTLGAEAELISSYLDVLQVRMGPRLRYSVDVPEALRELPLAPMLLQPLVENAIRHGLEPKIEGGEVALRARREGAEVVVEIADTGVGFAAATRGGLGLANLRERLRLLYPDRARLQIGENAPSGALVRVTLPA